MQTLTNHGDYAYQSKTFAAYGANRLYEYEGEDIGIRKVRVVYIVDVKYELK